MNIDIRKNPSNGLWFVIAHLDCGDAHDAFASQAEAVAFALDFYGGQLAPVAA